VTDWVGTTHNRSLPAATYGIVALGAALAYYALVRAILRTSADDLALRAAVGKDVKEIISPIVFVIGPGLALASPYAAYACYALVSIMWFVPDRRLAR
jgi:uncharacterized membrane protein